MNKGSRVRGSDPSKAWGQYRLASAWDGILDDRSWIAVKRA